MVPTRGDQPDVFGSVRKRPSKRPDVSGVATAQQSIEVDERDSHASGVLTSYRRLLLERNSSGVSPRNWLVLNESPARTPRKTPNGGCSHQSKTRPRKANIAKPAA